MNYYGPGAELLDFERQTLITGIFSAIREDEAALNLPADTRPLNPATISAFWLSDLPQLKLLSKRFKANANEALTAVNGAIRATSLISRWKGKEFAKKSSATKTDQCRRRDGNCVITGASEATKIARVVSFDSLDERLISSVGSALGLFWEENTIQKVQSFLQNPESIENSILLSPDAHVYWNKKLFALKPLSASDDRRTLQLQLFWLCPDALDNLKLTTAVIPEGAAAVDFYIPPPVFRQDAECGYRKSADSNLPYTKLFYDQSDRPIPSGHVITLITPDPDGLPLPMFEALELQWNLHRITALATAAGYCDDRWE